MRRRNSAACATSFILSTNTAFHWTEPDTSMPTTLPFSTPGASRPNSRRPVSFSGRASCLSRAAVPEAISGRNRTEDRHSLHSAVRQEIGMPVYCPCSLQRIPDLRTRRLLLTLPPNAAGMRSQITVAVGDPVRARWRPEQSRSKLLLSLVGHLESRMNIPTVCGAVILGGLVAMIAPTTASLAQSIDKGASAPSTATPNTNTNPTKHRYWRHRGGTHPHYGSRRVRT
jgi:hypothetical protein